MKRALVKRGGKLLWRCEVADTFFRKLAGLMFRRRFEEPLLFVFNHEGRQAIHSFFCFIDFDAIFLDSRGRIVSVFEKVKPFTPWIQAKRAKYLIEAPAGNAGYKNLKIGSRLKIMVKS